MQKQHDHFVNLKSNMLFAFFYNTLIFKFVCVIDGLKLIIHFVILQKLTTTNIAKSPVMCKYLLS